MSGRPKRAASARVTEAVKAVMEGLQEEEDEDQLASGAGLSSHRAGKAAAKRGAKRPAPDSDEEGDGEGGGADSSEDECSDEEVAAALRRGGAKKKAKTAAGTGGKTAGPTAAAGAKAKAAGKAPATAPRAKPAAKAKAAAPPAPPPAVPSCCDATTHAVLETLLLRGALHPLDVARLGCVSRFWRARAGGELEALSAAYKASLKDKPPGARVYMRVMGRACETCGGRESMGIRPDTMAPACWRHHFLDYIRDKTERLHVDVLSKQLLPLGEIRKRFYLTPADLAPLDNYSASDAPTERCWRLRRAACHCRRVCRRRLQTEPILFYFKTGAPPPRCRPCRTCTSPWTSGRRLCCATGFRGCAPSGRRAPPQRAPTRARRMRAPRRRAPRPPRFLSRRPASAALPPSPSNPVLEPAKP